MKKEIYDNYGKCPKCGEKNEIIITDTLENTICECDTRCFICKHEDSWAYGWYESNRLEQPIDKLNKLPILETK